MAHFRAYMTGRCGSEVSRLGTKNAGVETVAQSWQGQVRTRLYHKDGTDHACVTLEPHGGGNMRAILYDGPVTNWQSA